MATVGKSIGSWNEAAAGPKSPFRSARTNDLLRIDGINRKTLKRDLDLLDRSFIGFRLRVLSRNSRIEMVKGRTAYCYDLHLRNDVGAL